MAKPASITTGRIVAQYVVGVVDGADADDEPDFIPAQGSVTFETTVGYIPFPVVSGPNPITVLKTRITGILDDEGYLCTPDPGDKTKPGARGLRLVSTDNEVASVQGWTWIATPRFVDVNGSRLDNAIPPFPFHLPAQGPEDPPLDLATVVKVPASVGIGTVQAVALAASAQAAAVSASDSAEVAVSTALNLQRRADKGEFNGRDGETIAPETVAGYVTAEGSPVREAISNAVDARVAELPIQEVLGQYELQKYINMGDSWSDPNRVNITTGASPSERLSKRLSTGAITHRGFSSRTVEDLANINLGGTSGWTPGTKALVTITSCHLNNTKYLGTGPAAERGYKHAWRSLLSTLTAHASIAANTPAFTYSPGWTVEATTGSTTAQASNNSTGGTRYRTTTAGAYALVNVTGQSVDVFAVARKTGAGVMTVTNNATGDTLGTLDLTEAVAQETPAVLKLRNLGAGTRTLRITHTSGASLTLDSVRIPTTNPAPIILVPAPDVQNGGGNTLPAGDPSPNYNAAQATARAWMAEVSAEYPSVTICDLNDYGFDKVADYYTDLRHLNDRGAAKWAGAVMDHLKTRGYTQGLNMIGNDAGAYAAPAAPEVPPGGQDGAGKSPTPAVPGLIEDNFDLPNTTSGIGEPWREVSGTWGITNGEAYRASGSPAQGYLLAESEFSNGSVETKLTVIDGTYSGGVAFRASSTSAGLNCFMVSLRAAAGNFKYALFRQQGGNTKLAESTRTPVVGDVLKVTFNGPEITVAVNGETIITASDEAFMTNRNHGLYLNTAQGPSVTRFDYARLEPAT